MHTEVYTKTQSGNQLQKPQIIKRATNIKKHKETKHFPEFYFLNSKQQGLVCALLETRAVMTSNFHFMINTKNIHF